MEFIKLRPSSRPEHSAVSRKKTAVKTYFMSFTETLPSPTKARRDNATTTTILLTPRKRKHEPNANHFQPVASSSSSIAETQLGSVIHEQGRCKASHASILSWVFSKASVSPCFVKDVYEMEEGNAGEQYLVADRSLVLNVFCILSQSKTTSG